MSPFNKLEHEHDSGVKAGGQSVVIFLDGADEVISGFRLEVIG